MQVGHAYIMRFTTWMGLFIGLNLSAQGQLALESVVAPGPTSDVQKKIQQTWLMVSDSSNLTPDTAWTHFMRGRGKPIEDWPVDHHLDWFLNPQNLIQFEKKELWFVFALHNPANHDRLIWYNAQHHFSKGPFVRELGKWKPLPDPGEQLSWLRVQAPGWQTFLRHLPLAAFDTDTILYSFSSSRGMELFMPEMASSETYSVNYISSKRLAIWITGILNGITLAIFSLCILALFRGKDKVFVWYAVYCGGLLLFGIRTMDRMLPTEWSTFAALPWLNTKTVLQAFLVVAYYHFIEEFLGRKIPALRTVVRGITWVSGTCILLDAGLLFLGENAASLILFYWYRLVVSLTGLAIFYIVWRSKVPFFRLILVGTFMILFTELVSLFAVRNSALSNVAAFGLVFDLAFFSASIVYRQRILNKERMEMQKENERLRMEKVLEMERLRNQLSQDIHDEVGGKLTRISLMSHLLTFGRDQISAQEFGDKILKMGEEAHSAQEALQEVIFALNPNYASFEEVQLYFREFSLSFFENTAIQLTLHFQPAGNPFILSPSERKELLFIFKESLHNVLKHSKASQVSVILQVHGSAPDRWLELEVSDNGAGISPDKQQTGLGLRNLHERASRIGAHIQIESSLTTGTRVHVALPILT